MAQHLTNYLITIKSCPHVPFLVKRQAIYLLGHALLLKRVHFSNHILRLRDQITPEVFLHWAITSYWSSAFMVQPFVLHPTHGNQLWVYGIPGACLILWSRKKPPVQRKGPGMKKNISPLSREQSADVKTSHPLTFSKNYEGLGGYITRK
jgi:hypothetical protein